MEQITRCPVCSETVFDEFIQCVDHFLSNESFRLVKCKGCGLILTNPRPEPEKIGAYYKSEEYISHSNSKKGIVNRIYHVVRKISHRKKFKIINKYIQNGTMLDVGCATGEFLAYFKTRNWKVCGVEPDEDARKFAIENLGIEVFPESKLPELPHHNFDVITLWHVLEHVPDPNSRLKELHALLKDGGLLVIAVPNPGSYDAQYYGTYWAGYDVPRHLYHFTQYTANKIFEKNGFTCIETLPMKFDSYYVSFLSEKYKNSSSPLFKGYKIGCRSNRRAKNSGNEYSSLIYLLKKQKIEL